MSGDWLIAVHLWDWTVPSTVKSQEELLERFVSERMCNAVCIWPDHQPGRFELPLEAIEKHDLSVVMYFFTEDVYNWMQSHAWSGGKQDRLQAYVDHWVDSIVDLSGRRPGRVWWSMGHEHFDQALAQTAGSEPEKGKVVGRTFSTKRDAYEFYREWVLTDLHKLHWSAGHIRQAKQDRIYRYGGDVDIPPVKYALGHDNGIPSTFPYLEKRGIDPGDLFFGAGGTVACSAAYVFSLGPQFKFFWWECDLVGTGLQPGIAFIRGAAKQYGRRWLLDHSPYASRSGTTFTGPFARGLERLGLNSRIMSPGADQTKSPDYGLGTKAGLVENPVEWSFWWPQHDEDGNQMSGLSVSMVQRDWLWGFMSGADCIFQEAAAATHFVKVGDSETGELRLTPYGEAARQFYTFASDRCEDRGRTIAPVALLMDFYHGLDPAAEAKGSEPFRGRGDNTWGSVPFTPGDRMANGFFEAAFPGQSAWPETEKPWKSPKDYGHMLRAGLDERPWDRRTVVASTWGDIFDVILDNADPALISSYRAVVVLGDIALTPEWLGVLRSFTEAGGQVMVNAAQVPPEHWPEWLGCSPPRTRLTANRFCWEGDHPAEDRSFEFVEVRPNGARVISATPSGCPLVLLHQMGAGQVWLTTPEYLIGQRELLEVGRRTLERFLRPFALFRIDGPPLAHLTNLRENGDRLITLSNESARQWVGRVIIRGAAASEGGVRDLWRDRAVLNEASGEDLILLLVIPPWGLMVLEVKAPGPSPA